MHGPKRLLLGFLLPLTWQDWSASHADKGLRQAPTCCSRHAEDLIPEKPPGEVSKAGPFPTFNLLSHSYLSPPGPHPFSKMRADHLDASQRDFLFSLDGCTRCLHPSSGTSSSF